MGLDAPGRKEVRGRDPPQEPPVRPIGSNADGLGKHQLLNRLLDRAFCEVWRGEDISGDLRVGHDNGWSRG